MKKAKSQTAGSAAKKNSPKEEVRGHVSQTGKDGGLQPLTQKRGTPRFTTVPRDEATTTVPRDID